VNAAQFPALTDKVHILHQVRLPKSPHPIPDLTPTEKTLIAVRQLKQARSQIRPCGDDIEKAVRWMKAQAKAAHTHAEIAAHFPDGICKPFWWPTVTVQKEKQVSFRRRDTLIQLSPTPPIRVHRLHAVAPSRKIDGLTH
jgi:hypothetical protein